MSGGKKKKKSVNGSRQTTMNSLNKIAPSPRKSLCFMAPPRSAALKRETAEALKHRSEFRL
jgi:hypothetical protein